MITIKASLHQANSQTSDNVGMLYKYVADTGSVCAVLLTHCFG